MEVAGEIEVIDFDALVKASQAISSGAVREGPTSKDCLGTIERAFSGDFGLGVLVVRGVPGYEEVRRELLPIVRDFALLSPAVRERYEREDLKYQFGWSHGREVLENGQSDIAKGSYYANPFPTAKTDKSQKDRNLDAENNIWPKSSDCGPRVAQMQNAMEKMSNIMADTAFKIAELCDLFVESKLTENGVGEKQSKFHSKQHGMKALIKTLSGAKGRLLYYFPRSAVSKEQAERAKWCGWHCDHGSLTCLTKAMYFDTDGNEVTNDIGDDLAIETSQGRVVNVRIPSDCIAFQIGQAAHINSGALLRATPHCVAYPSDPTLSRCTYACFLQPAAGQMLEQPMPKQPASPLPEQFRAGMTFGDFTEATIEMVYRTKAQRAAHL